MSDSTLEIPVRLLRSFIDDEPCRWDHNHSCQEHGFFYLEQGELCPMEEARRLLCPRCGGGGEIVVSGGAEECHNCGGSGKATPDG